MEADTLCDTLCDMEAETLGDTLRDMEAEALLHTLPGTLVEVEADGGGGG